jgi:hypothetical protein
VSCTRPSPSSHRSHPPHPLQQRGGGFV